MIEITDPLFKKGTDALAKGDMDALKKLLSTYPKIVHQQLDEPAEGYFRYPYLLWFVADNPIRTGKLPSNIAAMAKVIIKLSKSEKVEGFKDILNYGLGLVVSGKTAADSGVQKELIEVFAEAGANVNQLLTALANSRIDAAELLLKKGAKLNLPMAAATGRLAEAKKLWSRSEQNERQVSLTVASFYGRTDMITWMLAEGVHPDLAGEGGFHHHATPLHQAVQSASIDAVKALIQAGANKAIKDNIHQGTPLDWARHFYNEETDPVKKEKYEAIVVTLE